MEFLGTFGVDWKLLLAQVVNFGLLVFVLSRFLYRPIVRRIEADEAELRAARDAEEQLAKERAAFETERNQALSSAKARAKEILSEAEEIAESIRNRAEQETESEKKAVIQQIRSRLHASESNQSENKERI